MNVFKLLCMSVMIVIFCAVVMVWILMLRFCVSVGIIVWACVILLILLLVDVVSLGKFGCFRVIELSCVVRYCKLDVLDGCILLLVLSLFTLLSFLVCVF